MTYEPSPQAVEEMARMLHGADWPTEAARIALRFAHERAVRAAWGMVDATSPGSDLERAMVEKAATEAMEGR